MMYRFIQLATLTMMILMLEIACNDYKHFKASMENDTTEVAVDSIPVDTLIVDTL